MEWIQSAALLIFFSDRLLLKDTVFLPSRLEREPSWVGGGKEAKKTERGGKGGGGGREWKEDKRGGRNERLKVRRKQGRAMKRGSSEEKDGKKIEEAREEGNEEGRE